MANVMGARADGWWRDRAGAALRLCHEVMALARQEDSPAGAWVLVLEGRAREAAVLLARGLQPDRGALPDRGAPPGEDWVPPADVPLPVRVVSAPGSGDDAIVGVVAEVAGEVESCLVVTADRELRRRCEELNASVVGPGWLLGLLPPGSIALTPHVRVTTFCDHLLFAVQPESGCCMYVILAILALLLATLLVLAARAFTAVRRTSREARKREAVAARLAAVAQQAAMEHRRAAAAARASAALTAVLPAIKQGEQSPRRVA